MRELLLAAMVVLFAAPHAHPWQWPVEEPVVQIEFGERVDEVIHRWIEFAGGAQMVFPISDGTVVDVLHETDLPTGQGNVVVIDHAQAFRSIYAHLDRTGLPEIGQIVAASDPIGTAGRSGHVSTTALRLAIIDLQTGGYVNPRLILPDLADIVRPRIVAVQAEDEFGVTPLARGVELPPGTYTLVARIVDTATVAGLTKGPYSISAFVDGQNTFTIALDRLSASPDGLRLGTPPVDPNEVLRSDQTFVLGDLVIGNASVDIEVVASDFRGNERVWSAEILIANEDVQQEP